MKYKLATPMTGLDVGLKREWLIGQQLNTITGADGELHGTLWNTYNLPCTLQLLHKVLACNGSNLSCTLLVGSFYTKSDACNSFWLHHPPLIWWTSTGHASCHLLPVLSNICSACLIAASLSFVLCTPALNVCCRLHGYWSLPA